MTTRNSIIERLQGWVDGQKRGEHVSSWVGAELMKEAIQMLRRDSELLELSAGVSIRICKEFLDMRDRPPAAHRTEFQP